MAKNPKAQRIKQSGARQKCRELGFDLMSVSTGLCSFPLHCAQGHNHTCDTESVKVLSTVGNVILGVIGWTVGPNSLLPTACPMPLQCPPYCGWSTLFQPIKMVEFGL